MRLVHIVCVQSIFPVRRSTDERVHTLFVVYRIGVFRYFRFWRFGAIRMIAVHKLVKAVQIKGTPVILPVS
jgi:hypothetical protein